MEEESVGRLLHDLRCFQELGNIPLHELGLTRPQAMVLMMSVGPPEWAEANPVKPLRASDLANMLGVSPAAISQMLSGLESRGLIQRRASATDRRAVEIWPTESGRHLASCVQDNYERLEAKLLSSLTPEERMALADLIARIEQLLEEETRDISPSTPALRRARGERSLRERLAGRRRSGGTKTGMEEETTDNRARPPRRRERDGKERACESISDT